MALKLEGVAVSPGSRVVNVGRELREAGTRSGRAETRHLGRERIIGLVSCCFNNFKGVSGVGTGAWIVVILISL